MALDLRAYKKEYFEVVLADGSLIKISKPSQALLLEIIELENELKENANDGAKMIEVFNNTILKIINNNESARKFNYKYVVNNFDFEIGQIFVKGYINFVTEVNNRPNL